MCHVKESGPTKYFHNPILRIIKIVGMDAKGKERGGKQVDGQEVGQFFLIYKRERITL